MNTIRLQNSWEAFGINDKPWWPKYCGIFFSIDSVKGKFNNTLLLKDLNNMPNI